MHMMLIGKEIILTLPKIAVSSEISNSHHCDPWALLSVPFLRSANRDTLRLFPSSVGTFFREPQKASSPHGRGHAHPPLFQVLTTVSFPLLLFCRPRRCFFRQILTS